MDQTTGVSPKNIRFFSKGEYLFRQGDPTQELFVVKSGSVRIFKTESNIQFDLATVGPGAVLGEITLIDRGLRSASGVAMEKTEVVSISVSEFDSVFLKTPEWFRKIALILVQRLREVNQKINKNLPDNARERISALITLLLTGSQCTKTDSGYEMPLKFLEDEIMDVLDLQPAVILEVFDGFDKQGVARFGSSKVTILRSDIIEVNARCVLNA